MCKRYAISGLLVALMILMTTSVIAQFRAQNLGGGMQFGRAYGNAEGSWGDPALSFRAYLRQSWNEKLETEISAGIFSRIASEDVYETELAPISGRLLYRYITSDAWSSYLYGGLGALHYYVKELPVNATAGIENKGWTAYVPFGAGVQFKISDFTSFEVSGGYNYALSDNLDGVQDGGDDGFLTLTAGLTMAGYDWLSDPDNCGLTNAEEKELGTDPNVADTDGDGLKDGEEVHQYQTQPLVADTDGDGLKDGEEVHEHKTKPTAADSDEDGLNDKDEIMTHGTDAMAADSDGDGLSDGEEIMTHKSNPLASDSDNDGLSDSVELNESKTKLLVVDTDGDNLSDGDEVLRYNTNPLSKDSDGGTVEDGVEIARGTDPLDKSDDIFEEIEEVGAAIVLEGISFELGKAEITAESEEVLTKVYNTLIAYPDMSVEIRGYTDNTGPRVFNVHLSKLRATAVKDYLVGKGIDANRIEAKGLGPDNPIATNDTIDGRRKNRRIEFVRTK